MQAVLRLYKDVACYIKFRFGKLSHADDQEKISSFFSCLKHSYTGFPKTENRLDRNASILFGLPDRFLAIVAS